VSQPTATPALPFLSSAPVSDGVADASAGVSHWTDIDGPLHYVDFGGPRHGPMIVGVHGLASSAVNWAAIAPLLTSRCRVIAPDLAGHGLTRSGRRSTGVQAQRRLLDRFLDLVATTSVILMGNSMGGMISLLEASAAPSRVSGLILIDPALPLVPARPDLLVATLFTAGGLPGLGPALLRGVHALPPEATVAATLSLCCQDPSRVAPSVIAQHVAVARRRAGYGEAGRDMAIATRSVIATAGPGGHAYRHGIAGLRCPVLLIHGERDRLVPVSAARSAARAHPSWSLVELPGVGHVPQLETPRECADAILSWLDSAGWSAAQAARSRRAAVAAAWLRRIARRPRVPGRDGSRTASH
jgi:pimeloyl-ACP methyl ester carboxylesterase